MKKNLFLRLCLILVVAVTAYSCRTDQFPENETFNNSAKFQLTTKRISLNESKHKNLLVPELEKAKTAFKNSKSLVNGKIVNYGNGVSIDTESVIYIENGPNFHTYTFNIKRENAPADAPLENLLLTPLAGGTYREFLVTYHLTPQEKENISNGYYFYSGADTTITELAAGTFNGSGQLAKSSCGWTSETYWVPCSSGKHDGSNFQSCEYLTNPNGTPPSAFTISTYTCADVKPVTIEQTPAPVGGGGSVGEGECSDCPGNTTPQPCVQIPTDPTNPSSGMVDENGCAIGLPTLPNDPPVRNNPCAKIKNWFNDPVFKEKYDTITKPGIHQLDRERAFYMRYPTVGTNIPPAYVEVNMPTCATDGNLPTFTEGMGGLMHTHNDLDCHGNTPIKAPSPTDIRTFFNTLIPEAGQYAGGYHNAYSLISTSGGNYMLMYNGISYPGSINYYANEKLTKEYKDIFEDLYTYNENISQADIEKVFTKFMKDKINKPGFEIYKVTPTSAIKLEYDPNSAGSVKRTNCP